MQPTIMQQPILNKMTNDILDDLGNKIKNKISSIDKLKQDFDQTRHKGFIEKLKRYTDASANLEVYRLYEHESHLYGQVLDSLASVRSTLLKIGNQESELVNDLNKELLPKLYEEIPKIISSAINGPHGYKTKIIDYQNNIKQLFAIQCQFYRELYKIA